MQNIWKIFNISKAMHFVSNKLNHSFTDLLNIELKIVSLDAITLNYWVFYERWVKVCFKAYF